ncbi:hypothetical protein [Streptacidiphilus pinicola]|nr:hypothetical protein [Streptacidiphilus pinicola]
MRRPTAEAGPPPRDTVASAAADDRARSLLRRLRSHPARMPEELAAFAVREMGPRAYAEVERLRQRLPQAGDERIRAHAAARGVRTTVAEGSFVGGPFLVLIPVAFCRALLAQVQMVLEMAALAGRDPRKAERAAELLVLQGAHQDVETAAAALAQSDTVASRTDRRPAGLWRVTMRMASILGLRDVGGTRRSEARFVRLGRRVLLGVVIMLGTVAPLVWLPYMSVAYRRAGRAMAERAAEFYFGAQAGLPADAEPDSGFSGTVLRALASVALVVVPLLLILLTGAQLADREWPLVVLVLVGSSLGVGAWWQSRHRAQRRRGDSSGL